MIGCALIFAVVCVSCGEARGYYKPRIGEIKGVFNAKHKLREKVAALDHQQLNLCYSDGPGDSREL